MKQSFFFFLHNYVHCLPFSSERASHDGFCGLLFVFSPIITTLACVVIFTVVVQIKKFYMRNQRSWTHENV